MIKKRALRYYDILQNLEPYTEDHLNMEERIRDILDHHELLTNEELEQINLQEEELNKKIVNSDFALKRQILSLNVPDDIKSKIYSTYISMLEVDPSDSVYHTYRDKIKWSLSLPYSQQATINVNLGHISNVLNEKMFGLQKPKERLLELVNNRLTNSKSKAMIGFQGSPGVGKTRIASVLAEALNLPFERISLGGFDDPGMFKGHDSVYVGSSPSIILQILKRMKCCNGIILFDEIDKLSSTERGRAVQYALLHITDYVQNKEFQDMYLSDFSHDISNVWFMFSLNDSSQMDRTLLDRIDIVTISDYTKREKIAIIQKHLIKNILQDVGLGSNDITIDENACNTLFDYVDYKESGLRSIDKYLHNIISKISLLSKGRLSSNQNNLCPSMQDINTLSSNKDNCISLSYDLKDFQGFPYVISSDTIKRLSDAKKDTNHLSMYS